MLKNSTTLKFLASTFVVAAFAFAFVASAMDFGSTTLKVGSKGEYVKTLQTLVGAIPDGDFGPNTKAKVATWQAANGLEVDGMFGKMSMAKANMTSSTGNGSYPAGCSSNVGFSTTTGASCSSSVSYPAGCTSTVGFSSTTGMSCAGTASTGSLSGSFGTVSSMTQISSLTSEEIGAGQKDIKVAGLDIKTTKDGDIGVTSMKLTFDSNGNNSLDSDRLSDYVTGVSIWAGSTKVGSSSSADFTKESTGVYSKTVQLSNAVVKADSTVKFYISVDAISNLDSGDIDSDSWTVAINSIRYVDGSGVTTTENSGGSVIPSAMDYVSAGDGVAMAFVAYSTAADTELKINLSSDAPQAGLVTVNTTSDTQDRTLLKGTFKVDGTSNVWLDEVPFLFTTNATNVDDVTPTVYFTIDGTEYSESMTSSAGTTKVITFNDLDKTLTAGKTYSFTVTADVNDIETSLFDEGDYLSAALDSTRRASIIAENDQGDQLTDGTEMTGVASGNIQYFYSISPKVEVVSSSITPNDNGSSASTSATAKLKLKITAQGDTLYLNGDDETTAAKEFITLAVDGGDATTSVASYTFTTAGTYTTTNSGSDNEYYTLNDGDSMTIEIQALVARGAGGTTTLLTGMKGSAILFGTASTDDTSRSVNSLSFTALTDILKTGLVSLSRTSA